MILIIRLYYSLLYVIRLYCILFDSILHRGALLKGESKLSWEALRQYGLLTHTHASPHRILALERERDIESGRGLGFG